MNGQTISSSLKSRTVIVAVLAVLTLARPAVAEVYTVTDLGTLGGDVSEASAINSAGEVVGASLTASGATRAFLYAGGAMTDLGTLPGGTSSRAAGINDSGQVIGVSGINEHGPQFPEFRQGFLWQGGAMRSLGALFCPCSFNQRYGTSAAWAINGVGQVVGDSRTVRGESIRHAFIWQDGVMEDLGGGPGSLSLSHAYGINGAGHVAGTLEQRATLWQGGVAEDLGTLPGHTSSTARAISAAGLVVGESVDGAGQSRAFLWRNGAMENLGVLPGDASSQANAINAAGWIVGWSGAAAGTGSRAFLWRAGAMVDLNGLLPPGSGWVLTNATAINDRGQIAGVGLHNGRTRAFLMAPDTPIVLRSAVLPSSRSVQVGATATAFATVINSGSDTATACRILSTEIPATFTFQTTDPVTNAVTGHPDAPVNIPGGQRQSFVIALTPGGPIPPTDVPFSFACANSAPAAISPGVNTLVFSASSAPVPDIMSMAATLSNDGIVTVPLGGTGVFAVATVNLGAGGTISVAADTGAATLPLLIAMCQTDGEGRCMSAVASAGSAISGATATLTFGLFVTATGVTPLDPAANRVFVRFRDASGVLRGLTSVAVRTN